MLEHPSILRVAGTACMVLWLVSAAAAEPTADSPVPTETITLEELIKLPEGDLAKIDIATMNLACAEGLRGSQNIDRQALLGKLDAMARHVAHEILRHAYRFEEHPEEYNHSWAEFCMLFLTNILQQDFGIRYNPAQITPVDDPSGFDFTRSQDLFINGLVEGTGGTCTSMPVLYVAIGRRLGFPLKLVSCPEHVFLRWDDPVTAKSSTSREPQEVMEATPTSTTKSGLVEFTASSGNAGIILSR